MKLNVGCGDDFRNGWLNVDCRPLYAEGAEFLRCELSELRERIPNDSCTHISARHVLEFLPWREVDATLCLLASKLAPGGVLLVEVTNVEAALKDFAESRCAFALLQRRLYGDQGHPRDAHLSAWTADSLRQRLATVGLRITSLEVAAGSVRAEAVREG